MIGAYFVEQLVKTFNSLYNGERIGKECDCTVLLLAQLYTFKVITYIATTIVCIIHIPNSLVVDLLVMFSILLNIIFVSVSSGDW